MKGATPDKLKEIHALKKEMELEHEKIVEAHSKARAEGDEKSDDFWKALSKKANELDDEWEKVAQPLLSDVYRDIYYQAVAQDPKQAQSMQAPNNS